MAKIGSLTDIELIRQLKRAQHEGEVDFVDDAGEEVHISSPVLTQFHVNEYFGDTL